MVQSRELVTEHIWSQVNIHCFGLPLLTNHGCDERNCGGVNCGTEEVPMASEG